MMTEETERHLNALIEDLQEKLEAAEERANEATQEAEGLRYQIDTDDYGWSNPRALNDHFLDLPVPRLEMHWTRDDECSMRCTYMLVYRHLLDGCSGPDDRKIMGIPIGQTKCQGGRMASFFRFGNIEEIDTPFRDGAHAMHDAKHLGLPLYLTTCDGAAASLDPETRKQTVIARAELLP